MDIKTLTNKKIAGVPAIYLALGLAIVMIYAAFRLKPSASPSESSSPENSAEPDIAGDADVNTDQPVFSATPTITQPSGVQSGASVSSVPQADTDDLWRRRAIDYLRQNGYTLELATSAITKYLAGDVLTTTEASARDKAVQQFGLPPESVPESTVNVPTTPTAPKPGQRQGTPPTAHTVTGTSDDTYAELSRLYYGVAGQGTGYINLLKATNLGTHEPIRKGTRVTIPKPTVPKYYRATAATRTLNGIASKNGVSAAFVIALNPGKRFPVAAGNSVRVG